MNIDHLLQGGTSKGKKRPAKEIDDDALVASLGLVKDADQYEQSVLRDAELSATPRLGNSKGLPPLHTILPSKNPQVDLPHVRTVLKELRSGQALTNPKDCLKEQMLLALLRSASGDPQMGVFPQLEAKQEWKRRKLYRENESSKARKVAPKRTTEKLEEKDEATPEGRLEGIKKGSIKSVRFAADVKGESSKKSLLAKKVVKIKQRRRISMQERRRNQTEGDEDKIYEKDETEKEQIVAQLKELRMERERRRKQRKTAWKTESDGESDSDDDEEFEFTGTEEPSNPQTIEKKEKSPPSRSVEATIEQKHVLICPLCAEEIPYEPDEKADTDAILAQHMSVCQTKPNTRRKRRTPGESLRPTRTNTPRQSYADMEDSDYHDDPEVYVDDPAMNCNEDDHNLVGEDGTILRKGPSKPSARTTSQRRRRQSKQSRQSKGRPVSSFVPLDDLYENDYEDRVDEWIENGLDRMPLMKERDANEVPPGEEEYEGGLIIPAWTNDRLFPYQRTGLRWMWELHRQQSGGILGDEMGLGKTIQVASFLGCMAASRKLKSILIISPATMLQHWLKEMAKWAPGVRRILIHQSGDSSMPSTHSHHSLLQDTGQRKISSQRLLETDRWLKTSRRNRLFEIIDEADLETRDPSSFCGTAYAFVTTFENVRRNEDVWTNHNWSYVVIDEAQKIRNPTADITLVCKRLRTPHRLALSGTPIQNDLRELWSIFDFVFPGRLGTLPAFETEFAAPIKKGGYSNASPMQVQLAYRCALLLKDLINPYLLRRLKKDIKEVQRMPGKKEQVLFCRLTDQQRMLYETFLRSDYVKKVFGGTAQLLGAITVMRKICNHPDLISHGSGDDSSAEPLLLKELESLGGAVKNQPVTIYDESDGEESEVESRFQAMVERSGKLEILAKILPVWKKQGHRVLIFCQWKKMLDIITDFVKYKGWKFGRLDGNTNVASRQRLVDTFNSDKSYFGMLCTTRTGGVGLNLVGADRIILYDPDWNPQTDAQARERAWRFGQEREVTVYRMICAGTIEEKIYQRQIFKTALTNSVLQNSKQRRLFTNKDLKDLFSLKADNGSIVSGAEGMTETAELTKGDGYVDPDDENAVSNNQEDDGETMRSVLKSKGLAGIFDHDVVEGKSKDKRASVREMESKAKKIAREALKNLQQSVGDENDRFENHGSRFGGGSLRSSNLLSSIAKRNDSIMNATSSETAEESKQHFDLLKDLRDFVRARAPTTSEILEEFSSQASLIDAAVFRRLLKSIALLQRNRWVLRSH